MTVYKHLTEWQHNIKVKTKTLPPSKAFKNISVRGGPCHSSNFQICSGCLYFGTVGAASSLTTLNPDPCDTVFDVVLLEMFRKI